MGLFRRKKKTEASDIEKVALKPIDYEPKIILAWAEAVGGNEEILLWLKNNGYEELVMASYAIRLKNEARDWLMKNGYAHLMAFIHAAEGNEQAQNWLERNQFDLLYHMAMAVENDAESWKWIAENATPDIHILTRAIKKVKDAIEENHNDIHSMGKDL